MQTEVAQRLRDWLREERIPHKEMADQLGITPGAMSSILSGRNGLSVDSFIIILNKFPELCPRWILLGEDGINHHQCGKFAEAKPDDKSKDEKIKMLEQMCITQIELINVMKKMYGVEK